MSEPSQIGKLFKDTTAQHLVVLFTLIFGFGVTYSAIIEKQDQNGDGVAANAEKIEGIDQTVDEIKVEQMRIGTTLDAAIERGRESQAYTRDALEDIKRSLAR